MDLGLADRVAIITGSSRGIGLAIAEALLAEGCRIVLSGRTASTLEEARARLSERSGTDRVMALSGDLTSVDDIRTLCGRVRERWGRVDIAVANVGTGAGVRGLSAGESEWTRLLTMNLMAPTRLVAELAPQMVADGGGAIVLIGSITGVEATMAPLAYSAAKAALLNFTKNAARELGASRVRVNCVAPGNIRFDGGSWDVRARAEPAETSRMIAAEVPLARFGTVEEVANVVTFLASDRASFMTGTCVVVDGGQTRSI